MKSLLVLILLMTPSTALLAPLKSSNGEADINSMASHILLLEQMLSALTTKVSDQSKALNDLSVLKSQYQILQSSLDSERKLREETIRNLTASIALLTTEVGYEVQLLHDITTQHDKEPLKFDYLRYNAGGGYHSTSGMFVAPVSGTYLFWCHVMNFDSSEVYIFLHHEGDVAAQGHVPNGYPFLSASITTVIDVKRGDNLWFYKELGSSKLRAGFSSYGGVLLRAN